MNRGSLSAAEARQSLHDIMQGDESFEEKARQALEIGRKFLGADNGHLTRIDSVTNHWEAIISTDPPDGQFPPGLELDLDTTYCRRVITEESPVALHDAPNQGWADDPAFQAHELHCYHGTTLYVENEPYGTVCFVAEDPRGEGFSQTDTMFAELVTRLIEREIERNQHTTELTRQKNLNVVLNRVLRHNLRNDMSVIRGYTNSLAQQLPNNEASDIILTKIDELLDLSEKVRDLEHIIGYDDTRQETDIVAVTGNIIDRVRQRFPGVSVSFEHPESVTAAVFPSFERALEELLENAAKHAGSSPDVRVTIRIEPNVIEVQIVDDGPGLSDQERTVLDTGVETPLMHGSGLGLWTAYWIITSHDGSITATSTDEGTEMSLTVPRVPEPAGSEPVLELQRARDQYKAAFEEAFDAMIIIDDDARIIEANPEAGRLYGAAPQDLLGRAVVEFLPTGFDFAAAWEAFQASGAVRDTVRVIGLDDAERPVEYAATTDIVPGLHLVIFRDITDRVEREEELRRKTRAMDKAPVGITISDPKAPDNPLIYANDHFCDLTGYENAEVVGRNCRFLQGEATSQESVSEIREAIESEDPVTVTLRNYRKDGSLFWNRVTIAPVRDETGDVGNYVGFQREVSSNKL